MTYSMKLLTWLLREPIFTILSLSAMLTRAELRKYSEIPPRHIRKCPSPMVSRMCRLIHETEAMADETSPFWTKLVWEVRLRFRRKVQKCRHYSAFLSCLLVLLDPSLRLLEEMLVWLPCCWRKQTRTRTPSNDCSLRSWQRTTRRAKVKAENWWILHLTWKQRELVKWRR